ncbi:MAG: (deoxy)nucleoside triphosphate pyrophosphohydrolase [Spirochaetales bacterium]|nr:(deoxy)nucleoside triphosphate pyrophosphohydrolase [Spirochaetales bacterium]
MKTIRVSAAIIINEDKILIAQRGYGDYKGYWEFPGGKREAGETGEAAAIREIKEELNLDIKIDDFLITIDYDYPTFHLTMDCYLASADVTEMHINEHQAISWISSKDLDAARWLPADILVVEELKKRI